MILELHETSKRIVLNININKTKVMCNEYLEISLDELRLEDIEDYIYW